MKLPVFRLLWAWLLGLLIAVIGNNTNIDNNNSWIAIPILFGITMLGLFLIQNLELKK